METAQLVEKLAAWIHEKVITAGCRGVVLGLSGGVDSAVVAVLCKRAFPDNTLAVLMPCYSPSQDEEHALIIANKFSIPSRLVVLDYVYDTLSTALPVDEASPEAEHLASANLKARIRMLTLYYFANLHSYMVVGSSNRSELAVGYFTKHGDGGVDIIPLGNLVKGHVQVVASFLGIPREIIQKPPSAGLWPEQTDEADLGISYEELDRYLTTGEASDKGRERINTLMAKNHHKCRLPAIPDFLPE